MEMDDTSCTKCETLEECMRCPVCWSSDDFVNFIKGVREPPMRNSQSSSSNGNAPASSSGSVNPDTNPAVAANIDNRMSTSDNDAAMDPVGPIDPFNVDNDPTFFAEATTACSPLRRRRRFATTNDLNAAKRARKSARD